MAVYTKVSVPDVSDFLNAYEVGALINHTPIQAGVENTNYKILTTQGNFILTLFEKRTNAADIPFVFAFQQHLLAHGIMCPTPVADRAGVHLKNLCGRPAAVINFLNGQGAHEVSLTPALYFQVGQLLARMHLAAQNFNQARTNPIGFTQWKILTDAVGTQVNKIQPNFYNILIQELEFLETHWAQNKNQLPVGIIHADFFPDNVFVQGAELIGVIDFYFACTEAFLYDLMLALGAWCFDEKGHIMQGEYQEFLTGYESLRPLLSVEKNMFKIAGRAAAYRILITRTYDYIFHDPNNFVIPKNPTPYLNILEYYHE